MFFAIGESSSGSSDTESSGSEDEKSRCVVPLEEEIALCILQIFLLSLLQTPEEAEREGERER